MIFEDWGFINYEQALNKQLEYVAKVDANPNHPGFLIFCSHPAVVTTGRQTQEDDIFSWQGPVVEVSRGGRATYHGPSQVVVYPIINVKSARKDRGPQEIRGFIRTFEQAIVTTLKEFGIEAEGRSSNIDDTGVWIGQQKIASLGIAVKKWITYHGAAINFLNDPTAFVGINPCGFKTETMISVEKIVGEGKISIDQFKSTLRKNLELCL